MDSLIESLLQTKNYEDLLFIYILNSKSLKPFPQFLDKISEEDRTILLEYILKARTPISINLRKIMLSRYFYEKLNIDEITGGNRSGW